MASTAAQSFPAWLQDMVTWIQSGGKAQMYDRAGFTAGVSNKLRGEGGVDLAAPIGTPVYALASGPLTSAQTFAAVGQGHPGAVLSQLVDVPGVGVEDIYYQHINLLPGFMPCLGGDCQGRTIQKGQEIGTVGSAGETEVGFNPSNTWGSLYGPPAKGPWPDKPEPWIADLMNSGGSFSSDPSLASFNNSNPGTGDCPVWCALTPFAQFGPCVNCNIQSTGSSASDQLLANLNATLQDLITPGWWARVGVILLGGILILIGGYKLLG
jgi:hypothetical protein